MIKLWKKTWQEFLSTCDASVLDGIHWIVLKRSGKMEQPAPFKSQSMIIQQITKLLGITEEEIRWKKGEWTEIVNYDDDPAIYLKVYKQGNIYRTDGRFYFDREWKQWKKKKSVPV